MQNSKPADPYARTVRRAALPEVLLPEDVAEALGIDPAQAEEAAREGRLGPCFLLGGRPAILRAAFLEHLALAAETPPSREVL